MTFGQAVIIGFGLCVGKFIFDFLCGVCDTIFKCAYKETEGNRNKFFDQHPDIADSLGYRKSSTCSKIGF